jgi:hypothetical protein
MAYGERFRNVRGREQQATTLIVVGIVLTAFGGGVESLRTWFYMGVPILIAGVILSLLNKRNTG